MTHELAKEIQRTPISIIAHSGAQRNLETATLLQTDHPSNPRLLCSQLLGYDGPFIANKALAEQEFELAKQDDSLVWLKDIVSDR